MQNLKTKQLTMESFGENLELYVDKIRNKKLDR